MAPGSAAVGPVVPLRAVAQSERVGVLEKRWALAWWLWAQRSHRGPRLVERLHLRWRSYTLP